jgi:hypothetical protein
MDATQGNQWDNGDILRIVSGIFVLLPKLLAIPGFCRLARRRGIEIQVPDEFPFVRGGRIPTARSAFASQA